MPGLASRKARSAPSPERITGFSPCQCSRARACSVSARGILSCGRRAVRRSISSSAALRVKVTAAMSSGGIPSSRRLRMRPTRVLVFPVPGPASTRTGLPRQAMALFCAGVKANAGLGQDCDRALGGSAFLSVFSGLRRAAGTRSRRAGLFSSSSKRRMVPYCPS